MMNKEAKNLKLGAVGLIFLAIAVLVVMNYYATGWDKYFQFQPVLVSSFLGGIPYLLGALALVGGISYMLWQSFNKQD